MGKTQAQARPEVLGQGMECSCSKPRRSFDLLASLEERTTLFFWAAAHAFTGCLTASHRTCHCGTGVHKEAVVIFMHLYTKLLHIVLGDYRLSVNKPLMYVFLKVHLPCTWRSKWTLYCLIFLQELNIHFLQTLIFSQNLFKEGRKNYTVGFQCYFAEERLEIVFQIINQ